MNTTTAWAVVDDGQIVLSSISYTYNGAIFKFNKTSRLPDNATCIPVTIKPKEDE